MLPLRRLALLAALAAVAAGFATAATAGREAAATRDPATPQPRERLVLALLEPERIASLDPRTGQIAQLQLAGGTLCRSPLLVVDGRIVFVEPGRRGGRVMSVDLALSERPRWLAQADVVVPSAVPGHVWLGTHAPRPRGHWLVQHLTVRSGTIARPPRRAPALPIAGAVAEGLVLQGPDSTFVWDPRTGRRLRGMPGVHLLAAAHTLVGSLVASCGGRCAKLLIADEHGRRVAHAPPGNSFWPTGAALSPTGERLGLTLSRAGGPRLALVKTATGAIRLLGGTGLGRRPAIAFSADGMRLYAIDRLDRVRAFTLDGRPLGIVRARVGAPVVQLLAAQAVPKPPPVPRFGWLPAGWRQFTDAPILPGGPARGSMFATSWPYRPARHGSAGALPAGGVLVSVQLLPDPRPERSTPDGSPPERRLVLPARPNGALEDRPDVPEYRIPAVCGTRRVEVRVDVAAPRLDPDRREQVQRMIDALVLPSRLSGCRPVR